MRIGLDLLCERIGCDRAALLDHLAARGVVHTECAVELVQLRERLPELVAVWEAHEAEIARLGNG